jgi:SAM-dependent methyltransferase
MRKEEVKRLKRWKIAQEAERKVWSDPKRALKDPKGWMTFLKSNFGLDNSLRLIEKGVTVEIGCGPHGVIHFVDYSEEFMVGLDSEPYLNAWKNFHIRIPHIVAVGEFLPLHGDTIDVIVCFNVLDHVFDPEKVVDEISRVLKRNGKLLLWVVTIRDFLRKLKVVLDKIDRPHPHHLTSQDILNFLQNSGLEISTVSKKNFQKGNRFFSFTRSIFSGRFKVAAANFLVCNTYIIAEKR